MSHLPNMGTLAILRSLLTYIQSEAHPVYRAGQRNTVRWLMNLDPARWGGLLFLLLLLAIPTCAFLQGISGSPAGILAGYHDEVLDLILLAAGGLLSVTWTVPFAMLAGQGISHERATQTWDTLRTTPYPTEEILLAKAAADIRLVWGRVTTTVLIGIFIALSMISTTILARSPSLLVGAVFIVLTLIAVIIERAQELALSAIVGILVSFVSTSHGLVLLLGMISGLAMRILQMIFVVIMMTLLAPRLLPQFSFLNTIVGTSVLMAAMPGVVPVLVVGCMIVVRELLIRQLFSWAVYRAREDQ